MALNCSEIAIKPNRYNKFIEKALNYLSTTQSIKDCAKNLRREYGTPNLPEASEKYKQLFTNAQLEIGIPIADLLPIQKTSGGSSFVARAGLSIQVDEEKLDELSYGAQRILALHEAYHHYFNDMAFGKKYMGPAFAAQVGLTAFQSWILITKINESNLNIATKSILYALSTSASFTSSFLFLWPLFYACEYINYKEYRADLSAVKKSKCYKCVQDYASSWSNNTVSSVDITKLNPYSYGIYNGNYSLDYPIYLTVQELKYFVNLFKEQNLLCEYHSKEL